MADKKKISKISPFESQEVSPLHTDHWEAKRRVAQAIRELTEVLVTSAPPIDELHTIAAELEKTASNFRETPRLYGHMAFFENRRHGNFGEVNHELNPLAGKSNPLAPPLKMWIDKDRAYAKATLGWSYEGPPNCVHGGYVAALFDQFMGAAQCLGDMAGMTGTLTTRYIKPTPVNVELRLEAWIEKIEGRKTTIAATMHAGETLTASCEALFIEPRNGIGLQAN
ncbi:PaaI family thioesterase [Halieaceae bacterium]|nr:PaaI family thioesterase [Halieaceae bacterium]